MILYSLIIIILLIVIILFSIHIFYNYSKDIETFNTYTFEDILDNKCIDLGGGYSDYDYRTGKCIISSCPSETCIKADGSVYTGKQLLKNSVCVSKSQDDVNYQNCNTIVETPVVTQTYIQPTQTYIQPTQTYIQPTQTYIQPTQTYIQPIQQTYVPATTTTQPIVQPRLMQQIVPPRAPKPTCTEKEFYLESRNICMECGINSIMVNREAKTFDSACELKPRCSLYTTPCLNPDCSLYYTPKVSDSEGECVDPKGCSKTCNSPTICKRKQPHRPCIDPNDDYNAKNYRYDSNCILRNEVDEEDILETCNYYCPSFYRMKYIDDQLKCVQT